MKKGVCSLNILDIEGDQSTESEKDDVNTQNAHIHNESSHRNDSHVKIREIHDAGEQIRRNGIRKRKLFGCETDKIQGDSRHCRHCHSIEKSRKKKHDASKRHQQKQ